jgi:hypothetical protein
MQISKFELIKNDGSYYNWPATTQITYGTSFIWASGQTPEKLLDHNIDTKMCA